MEKKKCSICKKNEIEVDLTICESCLDMRNTIQAITDTVTDKVLEIIKEKIEIPETKLKFERKIRYETQLIVQEWIYSWLEQH